MIFLPRLIIAQNGECELRLHHDNQPVLFAMVFTNRVQERKPQAKMLTLHVGFSQNK